MEHVVAAADDETDAVDGRCTEADFQGLTFYRSQEFFAATSAKANNKTGKFR